MKRLAWMAVTMAACGMAVAAKPAPKAKAAPKAKPKAVAVVPEPAPEPAVMVDWFKPEPPAEPLLDAPKPDEVPVAVALPQVPAKFLDPMLAEKPTGFLVDPQRLLPEAESKARRDFLHQHAGDSAIDLFVFVIGRDQEIPGDAREEEIGERLFKGGRPAVAAVYPYGAPDRARLWFSPSLEAAVPMADQRRALENAMIQALEKPEAGIQLERFLTQLSIQVFWMEQLLDGPHWGSDEAVAGFAARRAEKAGKDRKEERFSKFTAVKAAVAHQLPVVGVAAGAIGLVAAGLAFTRSRSRYRFPALEVEPRLGGPHAAGIGAVISFASASLPPASQKDQMPDYLRRA